MSGTEERLLSFEESLADYKKEIAAKRGEAKTDDNSATLFKHAELRNTGASKRLPLGKTAL
jgi:hypothetical protein